MLSLKDLLLGNALIYVQTLTYEWCDSEIDCWVVFMFMLSCYSIHETNDLFSMANRFLSDIIILYDTLKPSFFFSLFIVQFTGGKWKHGNSWNEKSNFVLWCLGVCVPKEEVMINDMFLVCVCFFQLISNSLLCYYMKS